MNPPATPGKSWPLFVLAGLSLIPVFGVLFGFIAACWGLVTDRPRGLLAAALGGAGAILNVVVIMAVSYAVLKKNPELGSMSTGFARMELDSLASHLEDYHTEHGRYPRTLVELPRRIGRMMPVLDHSTSLFNVTTQYQYRPSTDGQSYGLFGAGTDGIPDTPDDIFPSVHLTAQDSMPADEDTTALEE